MADKAVPIAGTVIAVGLNLSPGVLFYEYFRGERELDSMPYMMFIMGVFCGTTNLAYGFILRDINMIVNGTICDSIQVIYATLYLYFFTNKEISKFLLYSFIAWNLTFEVLYIFGDVIEYHTSQEVADNFTGIFNIFMTIFNAAAPGQKIIQVFRETNFTLIPIWTTVAQLLCSGLWGVYGLFIDNLKMIIPNLLGVLLCITQIVAYVYTRIKSGGVPPKRKQEENEENSGNEEKENKNEDKPEEKEKETETDKGDNSEKLLNN